MALKIVFIFVAVCFIQVVKLRSEWSEFIPSPFLKLLEERDNFAEAITLYEIYPKLLKYSKCIRLKYCYEGIHEKYKNFTKTFLGILSGVVNLLSNEDIKLPLKRLHKALEMYPDELGDYINTEMFIEAADLMRNTTIKTIFFDLRFIRVTTMQKKNINDLDNFNKENIKELREGAKAKGNDITIELLNCITTLYASLKPSNTLPSMTNTPVKKRI